MATAGLKEPLVSESQASPPVAPPFPLLPNVLNILLIVSFVLILQLKPDCDQPLSTWFLCLICIQVVWLCLEILFCVFQCDGGSQAMCLAVLGVALGGVWAYGHFPVYQSMRCDAVLWYAAFTLVTVGDVVVFGGLIVVVVLCTCVKVIN